MSDNMTSGADDAQQAQFAIHRIYTKDLSFEAPNSPEIYLDEWKPDVDLNLRSESRQLEDGVHEVVLVVTVTAKVGEKTAFLVEAHQGAVFTMTGFPEDQVKQMIGTYCLNILFPYARELVSDLVNRGGFPQLLLAPVNFDALYAQQQQSQQAGPPSSA